MAIYHDAPFTIIGAVAIPEDAMPAVGVDEYGNAEEVQALSESWAPDDKVGVELALADVHYLTVTLTTAWELQEGFSVDWDWGDGVRETGHDLVQGHQYARAGSYMVTAQINEPGKTSTPFFGNVSIPDELPPEAPVQ